MFDNFRLRLKFVYHSALAETKVNALCLEIHVKCFYTIVSDYSG